MALNLNEEILLEIWGNLLENDTLEDALHDNFDEAWEANILEFILLPDALGAAAGNNDDEEEAEEDDETPSSTSASTEDDGAEVARTYFDQLINTEEDDIRKRLKATRLFTQLLRKEITVKKFMDEYIAIRNDEVDNYLDDFIPQHI